MNKRVLSVICAALLLGGAAVYATGQTGINPPVLQSETAVLMDADTGQVLFDKSMHQQMNPASITKIMTALLALEEGDPAQKVTMSHDAVFSIGSGTSNIALQEGEEVIMEQLLYAMAIKSANEAANGIAEAIGGTMTAFAEKMTARAKELGALNTTFKNAHGLTEEGHLTTAYDMALITMAAIQEPQFTSIFNTRTYTISPTNKQSEARPLSNNNGLMSGEYQYQYLVVSKAGITTAAGNTLVSVAKKDGRTLIAVVLRTVGDPTLKYQDTIALFNYGFEAFTSVTYTAEDLSPSAFPAADAEGRKVKVDLKGTETTLLLLNSLSADDIAVEYSVSTDLRTASAAFTLKDPVKDSMNQPLAVIPLTVVTDDTDDAIEAAGTGDTEEKKGSSAGQVFLTVLAVLLGLCALAFLGLFTLRQINLRKRRNRRRRRIRR